MQAMPESSSQPVAGGLAAAVVKPLSFASVVKGSQTFALKDDYVPGMKKFFKEGCPAVSLSPADEARGEAYLSNVLILKFSSGRPLLKDIRLNIESFWGLQSQFVLGSIDHRHILLRLSSEKDVVTALSREKMHVKGYWYRIQRWSSDFNLEKDSCMAQVWVLLPGLPLKLYEPTILQEIMSGVGEVLRLDDFTKALALPTLAKVCVQMDISRVLPERLWVELPSGENFWQKIAFEKIPKFCNTCFLQGHSKEECRKQIKEKKTAPAAIQRHFIEGCKKLEELNQLEEHVSSKVPATKVARDQGQGQAINEDGFQVVFGKKKGLKAKQVYVEKAKDVRESSEHNIDDGLTLIESHANGDTLTVVTNHLGLEKITEGEEGEILNVNMSEHGEKDLILVEESPEKPAAFVVADPMNYAIDNCSKGNDSQVVPVTPKVVDGDYYRLSKSAKKRLKKKNKQSVSAAGMGKRTVGINLQTSESFQQNDTVLEVIHKAPVISSRRNMNLIVQKTGFGAIEAEVQQLNIQNFVNGDAMYTRDNMEDLATNANTGGDAGHSVGNGHTMEQMKDLNLVEEPSGKVSVIVRKLEQQKIVDTAPLETTHVEHIQQGFVQTKGRDEEAAMAGVDDEVLDKEDAHSDVKGDTTLIVGSGVDPPSSAVVGTNLKSSVCMASPWAQSSKVENKDKNSTTFLVPTKLHDGKAKNQFVSWEEYSKGMVPSEDEGLSERDVNLVEDDSSSCWEDEESCSQDLIMPGYRKIPMKSGGSPHPNVYKAYKHFEGKDPRFRFRK